MKTDVFTSLTLSEARSIVEYRLEDAIGLLNVLQSTVYTRKGDAEKWAETTRKAISELSALAFLLDEMAKVEKEQG